MKIGGALLVVGIVSCCGARAQDAAPSVGPSAKPLGFLLVLGKPYSGVQEYEFERKLGNGKIETVHETDRLSRDSAGRIRKEISRDKDRVVTTYLTDPAAKVQYRWNSEQKIAYVTKLGEPIPVREATHPLEPGEVRDTSYTLNGKRMKATINLLPAKTIEKQETLATHLAVYSDADKKNLYLTIDRWLQPDYRVTLQEDMTDPQYGHRQWHFKSFKPEEPKADLFQVPKGYTLKEAETAESEQFE